MNIDRRFECAARRMPKQDKWTSIKEKDLAALKARSALLDEACDIVSKILQFVPPDDPLSDEISEWSKKLAMP